VRGVGEGFAFLRTQPVLLMTFVVDIIAMCFAWPQAVFPELSETRFADSPNSLGWLFAGVSIGALLMGLTSGWVSRVDRQGAVVLGAIVVWALAIIGFGLALSSTAVGLQILIEKKQLLVVDDEASDPPLTAIANDTFQRMAILRVGN